MVTGDKGYCTVRGTHSVRKGKWFFEVLIKELPGDSAVRVGWSQKYASIQNPVGCDVFGYSIRSKKGTVFHKAKGKSYTNKVNKNQVFLIIKLLLRLDFKKEM